MTTLLTADGPLRDRVLETRYASTHNSLPRRSWSIFHAAQLKTAWGRRQRTVVVADGCEIVASAEQYDLIGVFEGRQVRMCGIGSVLNDRGGIGEVVERLVGAAARQGADIAVIFSDSAIDDEIAGTFETIRFSEVTLSVAQSPRHGAPMTLVAAGESATSRQLSRWAEPVPNRFDSISFATSTTCSTPSCRTACTPVSGPWMRASCISSSQNKELPPLRT